MPTRVGRGAALGWALALVGLTGWAYAALQLWEARSTTRHLVAWGLYMEGLADTGCIPRETAIRVAEAQGQPWQALDQAPPGLHPWPAAPSWIEVQIPPPS
jgi:hypothetical protein